MTEAYASLPDMVRFYGEPNNPGAQIPFNFELISNVGENSKAVDYEIRINNWLAAMPEGEYFANWVVRFFFLLSCVLGLRIVAQPMAGFSGLSHPINFVFIVFLNISCVLVVTKINKTPPTESILAMQLVKISNKNMIFFLKNSNDYGETLVFRCSIKPN